MVLVGALRLSSLPSPSAEIASPVLVQMAALDDADLIQASLEPEVVVKEILLPEDQDIFVGSVRALDGHVMSSSYGLLRLADIRSPDPDQMCLTLSGTPVSCRERTQTQIELFTRGRGVHCRRVGDIEGGVQPVSCRVGQINVAHWLVRQGWAIGQTASLAILQRDAQDKGLGLWRL